MNMKLIRISETQERLNNVIFNNSINYYIN